MKYNELKIGDIFTIAREDNGVAYRDDSNVVSLVVRKHYAETTHVKVMLCSADMVKGEWYESIY